MKHPSKFFTASEIESIEAAIKTAEEQTSAEIVPVVVSASDRYERAISTFGFIIALIALCGAWTMLQGISTESAVWSEGPVISLGLPLILVILVLGYIAGLLLAGKFPVVRLPFIARREMEERVEIRARESFQQFKIRKTKNATGILIYISLYEHCVHVLGDDSISDKLEQNEFQSVCDTILKGFKGDSPAEGMQNGILECGDLLAPHFPIEQGDRNELSNVLHLIDQA